MSKIFLGTKEVGVQLDSVIDDTTASASNTWSGSKINSELAKKLDTTGTAAKATIAEKATADASGNIITDTYMNKSNPVGTGSFSLNRKADTIIGDYSVTEGVANTASGGCAHAEGEFTTAAATCAHAEGDSTGAYGDDAHAEGYSTTAGGICSHAEGESTTANGVDSHAEGHNTKSSGVYSHSEGDHTLASSQSQHAQGKFNVEDTAKTYADIVGNGTDNSNRSNASALDWDGNLHLKGDIYTGCNADSTGGTSLTDTLTNLIVAETYSVTTNDIGFAYVNYKTGYIPIFVKVDNEGGYEILHSGINAGGYFFYIGLWGTQITTETTLSVTIYWHKM